MWFFFVFSGFQSVKIAQQKGLSEVFRKGEAYPSN